MDDEMDDNNEEEFLIDDSSVVSTDDDPSQRNAVENTRLVQALIDGEPVDVIRAILLESPGLVQQKVDRMYPLSYAVQNGSPVEIVKALHGCWPESICAKDDRNDGLPLHHVCHRTPVETVQLLVDEFRTALRCRDSWGRLPIHASIENGATTAAVRIMVERHPESLLVTSNNGRLPIHLAAVRGQRLEVVAFLADQRPESLLAATTSGHLPAHLALLEMWPVQDGVIQLLTVEPVPRATRLGLMHFMLRELKATASEWEGRRVPPLRHEISRAIRMGYPENMSALAEAIPATLRCRDSEGSLPIHVAVQLTTSFAWSQFFPSLVAPYPESLLTPNGAGELPLHIALNINESVAEFLFESSPQSALEVGRDGNFPIHTAVANRWFGLAKSIAERHPLDARQRDARLRTPMHVASALKCWSQGDSDKLLDAADVLVRSWRESLRIFDEDGNLPIHLAIRSRTDDWAYDFVHFLVEHRPDGPNSLRLAGVDGMLPLHVAVSKTDPSPSLVQLLVDSWTDALHVRDAKGNSVLRLAHANPSAPLDVIYILVRARPELLRSGFS